MNQDYILTSFPGLLEIDGETELKETAEDRPYVKYVPNPNGGSGKLEMKGSHKHLFYEVEITYSFDSSARRLRFIGYIRAGWLEDTICENSVSVSRLIDKLAPLLAAEYAKHR